MNSEIRAQVVENALRVDSLQQLVNRQNLYIMNIQDIFQGKIKADTIHSIDSLTHLREDSLMNVHNGKPNSANSTRRQKSTT